MATLASPSASSALSSLRKVFVCSRSIGSGFPATSSLRACHVKRIRGISSSPVSPRVSPPFRPHPPSLRRFVSTQLSTGSSFASARPACGRLLARASSSLSAAAEAGISGKEKEIDGELQPWANGGGLVHRLASVDPSVVVEAGAVVHAGASIGEMSHIGSCSVVGPDVIIGTGTRLWYNVSLANCTLGDHCVLHHGVSIGQDGFGFYVDEKGCMVKKPQTLGVVVHSHVEIGGNTCIDRGSWRDTVIGEHCKIDNLVQIGHNVVMGKCCILCGQVGVGGSATDWAMMPRVWRGGIDALQRCMGGWGGRLGDYVVLAGQSGVADHVTIISKVKATEWRRSVVGIRRLGRTPSPPLPPSSA
eukprot:jgi/Mesen1/9445/ME000626S08696